MASSDGSISSEATTGGGKKGNYELSVSGGTSLQEVLQVDLPRHGAFYSQRRAHPFRAHARQQGNVRPQLRGTLTSARSPRHDQTYKGASEVFEPIPYTNTSRLASVCPATIARQAALKNSSSRSAAPTDLFFC